MSIYNPICCRENSDQADDTETVHTIARVHLPKKSGKPADEPVGDLTDFALVQLEKSVNDCEEKATSRTCWPIRPVRLPDPYITINNGDSVRMLGESGFCLYG